MRLPSILRRTARTSSYVPADATIRAARKARLSVEAYVERLWGQEGQTAAIVERMATVGALGRTDTVVEIGPGTGRYLARVREAVRPRRHVIYEPADDWRRWLVAEYGVEAPAPSGETLDGVDAAGLIHAHGVFVYTPFLVTARYFAEIQRVATDWVAFDFYSISEFDEDSIRRWLATSDRYPVVLERLWVLSRFPTFDLVDEWTAPHGHGQSRYIILRRRGDAPI